MAKPGKEKAKSLAQVQAVAAGAGGYIAGQKVEKSRHDFASQRPEDSTR